MRRKRASQKRARAPSRPSRRPSASQKRATRNRPSLCHFVPLYAILGLPVDLAMQAKPPLKNRPNKRTPRCTFQLTAAGRRAGREDLSVLRPAGREDQQEESAERAPARPAGCPCKAANLDSGWVPLKRKEDSERSEEVKQCDPKREEPVPRRTARTAGPTSALLAEQTCLVKQLRVKQLCSKCRSFGLQIIWHFVGEFGTIP